MTKASRAPPKRSYYRRSTPSKKTAAAAAQRCSQQRAYLKARIRKLENELVNVMEQVSIINEYIENHIHVEFPKKKNTEDV